MCDEQKAMGLLAQIAKGMLKHGKSSTASQLGDRSEYIGMSDIGCGVECLRKAIGNKTKVNDDYDCDDITRWFSQKDYEKIERVLSRQLILQRGHWFESGILDVLYANTTNLFSQLEIEVEISGVPVKAHLDFVLVAGGDKPAVRILELKSCDRIPKQLYTAYEVQLYGQIGLLEKFWNKKVFNLKSESGEILFCKMSFPEMVSQAFGIELPDDVQQVDLEGWILALSMKNAKAFGPYVASEIMTDLCVHTAEQIWNYAKAVKSDSIALNELEYAEGFHALCDFCDFADGCPKFRKVKLDDDSCTETLTQLDKLKQQKKELCSDIEHIEQKLKEFYHSCNLQNEWIDVGEFCFRCCETAPRKSFDKEALKSELIERIGEEEANDFFNRHTKVGSSSERLYVKSRAQ